MFGAETVVQAQRDAIIVNNSDYNLRMALTIFVFVALFSGGFLSGFFVWHNHAKGDIRDMIALEIEKSVENHRSEVVFQ